MRARRGGFASERVGSRFDGKEHSLYAREAISTGELVAAWSGEVVTLERVHELGSDAGRTVVQIDEGLFLESTSLYISDWVNHSCDPNLGLRGQIVLVARRPITKGEELCLDYAMTDGCSYDEFDCVCGSKLCRGRVTGNDWKLSSLQRRYRGYFSPYLAVRIARARKTE